LASLISLVDEVIDNVWPARTFLDLLPQEGYRNHENIKNKFHATRMVLAASYIKWLLKDTEYASAFTTQKAIEAIMSKVRVQSLRRTWPESHFFVVIGFPDVYKLVMVEVFYSNLIGDSFELGKDTISLGGT
jgi:hypothetical protein